MLPARRVEAVVGDIKEQPSHIPPAHLLCAASYESQSIRARDGRDRAVVVAEHDPDQTFIAGHDLQGAEEEERKRQRAAYGWQLVRCPPDFPRKGENEKNSPAREKERKARAVKICLLYRPEFWPRSSPGKTKNAARFLLYI